MKVAQTYGQVEAEALRRAKEDGKARVVFEEISGELGIWLLETFGHTALSTRAISYVWPDGKVEQIGEK